MKSGLALTAFPPPKLSLHSHGICTAVLREQKTQTGFFGARRWGAPLLCSQVWPGCCGLPKTSNEERFSWMPKLIFATKFTEMA